jgi:N6-adenosine-specific RNA methylase IME4
MRFPILYIDPPWEYDNNQSGDPARGGTPYDRMSLDDLKAIRPLLDNITSRDAVMLMWVTMPKLPQALELLDAWDMRFVTVPFVWVKLNSTGRYIHVDSDDAEPELRLDLHGRAKADLLVGGTFSGLGYWSNGNAEMVVMASNAEMIIMGKTGAPQREAKDVKQIIYAPVSRHSKKPDEARHRIVRMLGYLPRIEIFSTEDERTKDGWVHAGYEVDGLDIRESLDLIARDSYLSAPVRKIA